MKFDDYQQKAAKYDTFTESNRATDPGFVEKVLGLTGEAGETADKIKKIIRDKDGIISEEDKGAIVKELGDVMWYVASLARLLNTPLSEVAKINIDKLEDRYQRNKIHGAGDER